MYIVGFAETVRDLLKESDLHIIDADMWDVRIVGFGQFPSTQIPVLFTVWETNSKKLHRGEKPVPHHFIFATQLSQI